MSSFIIFSVLLIFPLNDPKSNFIIIEYHRLVSLAGKGGKELQDRFPAGPSLMVLN